MAATITGPRTLEQVTDSQRALELTLTDNTLDKLDEIWPGPGGEGPTGQRLVDDEVGFPGPVPFVEHFDALVESPRMPT